MNHANLNRKTQIPVLNLVWLHRHMRAVGNKHSLAPLPPRRLQKSKPRKIERQGSPSSASSEDSAATVAIRTAHQVRSRPSLPVPRNSVYISNLSLESICVEHPRCTFQLTGVCFDEFLVSPLVNPWVEWRGICVPTP